MSKFGMIGATLVATLCALGLSVGAALAEGGSSKPQFDANGRPVRMLLDACPIQRTASRPHHSPRSVRTVDPEPRCRAGRGKRGGHMGFKV